MGFKTSAAGFLFLCMTMFLSSPGCILFKKSPQKADSPPPLSFGPNNSPSTISGRVTAGPVSNALVICTLFDRYGNLVVPLGSTVTDPEGYFLMEIKNTIASLGIASCTATARGKKTELVTTKKQTEKKLALELATLCGH